MFANARLVLPPTPDVVTVPETAVDQTLYGDSVFVVQEEAGSRRQAGAEGGADLRQDRARSTTARIAILEGVAAGDQVVASGQLKLQNGAPVQITADSALTAAGPAAGRNERPHGARAMRFTDIFIRRPVLATVVSLLILLIGAAAPSSTCRCGSTRSCRTP